MDTVDRCPVLPPTLAASAQTPIDPGLRRQTGIGNQRAKEGGGRRGGGMGRLARLGQANLAATALDVKGNGLGDGNPIAPAKLQFLEIIQPHRQRWIRRVELPGLGHRAAVVAVDGGVETNASVTVRLPCTGQEKRFQPESFSTTGIVDIST